MAAAGAASEPVRCKQYHWRLACGTADRCPRTSARVARVADRLVLSLALVVAQEVSHIKVDIINPGAGAGVTIWFAYDPSEAARRGISYIKSMIVDTPDVPSWVSRDGLFKHDGVIVTDPRLIPKLENMNADGFEYERAPSPPLEEAALLFGSVPPPTDPR